MPRNFALIESRVVDSISILAVAEYSVQVPEYIKTRVLAMQDLDELGVALELLVFVKLKLLLINYAEHKLVLHCLQ